MPIRIIQNHFAIRFQMKSAADLRVFKKILTYRKSKLSDTEAAIGDIYNMNFKPLDDKTLSLSGYFDGDFNSMINELAVNAGTVFDALFRHVQNPPTTPVAANAGVFINWIDRHRVTLPYPVGENFN